MKFGKRYQNLQQNPIFKKYLEDAQFFPYKHLKTLIKILSQITDQTVFESQNEKVMQEFSVFIKLTVDYVDSKIKGYIDQEDDHLTNIKFYKALKQYCLIVKEAIRKSAKKYDKMVFPENPFYQKQILKIINKTEFGNQEQIDILLAKAEEEEQELLENQNFNFLLQDVHHLHSNQSQQVVEMLNIGGEGSNKQTHYKELVLGFILVVSIPILLTPRLDTGLSLLGNIFILTLPLAFFLGQTLGGNYGNFKVSEKQALYLGLLFELQIFGALTLGGFAYQIKEIDQFTVESIKPNDFRAYTEDINFVTLGIPSLMTFLNFNIAVASIYSQPISVEKNMVLAILAWVDHLVKNTDGIVTEQFGGFMSSVLSPPIFAFIFTLIMYYIIFVLVQISKDPYKLAIKMLPILSFLLNSFLSYIIIYHGLNYQPQNVVIGISLLIGSISYVYFYFYGQSDYNKYLKMKDAQKKQLDLKQQAINVFRPLVLFSALYSAFVSGSEDVGKYVKPFVAILNFKEVSNTIPENITFWAFFIVNISICTGILGLISRYTKAKLTQLNPVENFTIQLGATAAIILAVFFKYTFVQSYCIIGAVIAINQTETAVNWLKIKKAKHVRKLIPKFKFIIPFISLYLQYLYFTNNLA